MSVGRLLTTRQVADAPAVSPETVLRKWRAGQLPGYRLASNVLRFAESDVYAWLAAHKGPGMAEEVAPVPCQSPGPDVVSQLHPSPT
jgi:excisionase family DNA binding protein